MSGVSSLRIQLTVNTLRYLVQNEQPIRCQGMLRSTNERTDCRVIQNLKIKQILRKFEKCPVWGSRSSNGNNGHNASNTKALVTPEMEFNEFEPRFKSAKTRFKLSAGLNLETFDTILSGTNHI